MAMGMYMKENGKMINVMEKECILISMDQAIKVNGFKIYSKDMVFKNGLMAQCTRDIISQEKNMVKAN